MDQPVGQHVGADALIRFVGEIFEAVGCDAEEAARIGRFLVSANLTGHDSHGVIRVPRYVQYVREKRVIPGQSITIVSESATHAVVDGNFGFGQTVAPQAVDLGIAKAKAFGTSVIALRNAGHIGRVGDWGERAAEAGLIAIHFVNVSQGELVAPYGGVDRRFSTNPFCIAVPQPDGPPLLLDMATSLVAEGKVLVASNGGKKLPEGALIGPDGKLSTDPATLYGPYQGTRERNPANGQGSLRAFGDHKGSALAFMCDILAGCLTGGGTSGPIPGGKRTRIANGMLSIYLDPGAFGASAMAEQARQFAEYVKAARPATPGGEVLVPGEPEARTRAERMRDGVPLQPETWAALTETADQLGVTIQA